MQLNTIPLISYEQKDAGAAFVLQCSFADALALDGQELSLTDGDTQLAVYGGYHIVGLEYTAEGYTRAAFFKVIDPDTQQSISALEANLGITNRNLNATNDNLEAAQSQIAVNAESAQKLIEANAAAIEELATAVYAG